jgi:hypothetical protein
MTVIVDSIHVAGHSTIAYGVGRSERDELVHFAGDWRPMLRILEAVQAGEEVTVELEPWQIVAVIPPESTPTWEGDTRSPGKDGG